jgi:hypothetical protein
MVDASEQTDTKKADSVLSNNKNEDECGEKISSIIQLNSTDAVTFMRNMLEKNQKFKKFYNEFTDKGFDFIFERAKVFLYAGKVKDGIGSNLLGILPSFKSAKSCDPFHLAFGISVLDNGDVYATGVKVEHNPFRITEFTMYGIDEYNTIVSSTVKTSELESLSVADIANGLTVPTITSREKPPTEFASLPKSHVDKYIIATTFEQLINDKYARPIYTTEGIQSLMGQIPIMQKYAAIYTKRAVNEAETRLSACVICTSSSSNACTSTSVASCWNA